MKRITTTVWVILLLAALTVQAEATTYDKGTIKVFVEGNTISANLVTGQVVQEKVAARPRGLADNGRGVDPRALSVVV